MILTHGLTIKLYSTSKYSFFNHVKSVMLPIILGWLLRGMIEDKCSELIQWKRNFLGKVCSEEKGEACVVMFNDLAPKHCGLATI